MKNSLQFHLSRMLAIAILAAGLPASLASFYFAYSEAQEFQDDALRQIAILSMNAPIDAHLLAVANASLSDPEARIKIIRLPSPARPVWLPVHASDGFHTLDNGHGRVRVFIAAVPGNDRLAVIQPTDARDEIAFDSALRTLLPLLLLLPLLIGLVIRIVHEKLAGMRRLSAQLDRQSATHLSPLPQENLPDELAPLVQAINGLLTRVTMMVASQRRFIADAAHELRSPLTALSLQVQNLEQAPTRAEAASRITRLREGLERARHLIEQMLSLAQAQASSLEKEPVHLSRLARDLIAEYLPLAEAKAIDLGLEEDEPLVLESSLPHLRFILKNGLDNALRYTPQGGEVTVRICHADDACWIDVIDSGPGLPDGEKERVFAPFYRLPDAPGEGSGLGLAIARDAAERLGGQLSLERRDDAPGLIFRYRQRWPLASA